MSIVSIFYTLSENTFCKWHMETTFSQTIKSYFKRHNSDLTFKMLGALWQLKQNTTRQSELADANIIDTSKLHKM